MANQEDTTYILKSKIALPNKLLQNDGTITDLMGNAVVNPTPEFISKPAVPNKFLNPDGTYSTLNEILSGSIDTELFIIVDELPETGNPQKIYLVPDGEGGFVEYHFVNDKWDPVGTVTIDLSKYSTTQEMMEAIGAAALQTLLDAKAYTDSKMSNVPNILYWTGEFRYLNAEFTELLKLKGPTIVYYMKSDILYRAVIPDPQTLTSGTMIKFYNVSWTKGISSVTRSTFNVYQVTIKFGEAREVTTINENLVKLTISYLDTDYNYGATDYVPQYPGSPANKKYVDDSIQNSITSVLGGEY